MRLTTLLTSLLLAGSAQAHQLTPSYFNLEPSAYGREIYEVTLDLFNTREDVKYYMTTVYDAKWKPVPFATPSRVVRVPYYGSQKILVLIRSQDVNNITYICTDSKVLKFAVTSSGVTTRICSKIKD